MRHLKLVELLLENGADVNIQDKTGRNTALIEAIKNRHDNVIRRLLDSGEVDFSNKDISRVDDIIDQYEHRILGEEMQDGHTVYQIEAIPHEDAAVVWGKEILNIRDDNVLVDHSFYDQDGELVKVLVSLEIGDMGGRVVAIRQRMRKVDEPDEWTEIVVDSMEFDLDLRDSLFTLSNLRNPRD